ncbi:MAG: Uma2 family endonuclease [Aphanocapsa sp. GSE-SYN-MK-11-07L]|jgi:Uma2 family endonuclease|nr:Uma2 family endonuclease [Aphanocapsa sp. GSE-SYN-MK-11-07L]
MTALTLNLEPITDLTDEQFKDLCQANPDLQLELTAAGELIVMPPTGWESGRRNANLTTDLNLWNRQAKLGIVFDSSTGFKLPNGAIRSPDAAWVKQDRLDALNSDPDGFLPLAPDFVIELRSASDRLKPLQAKMQEYIENGVRLGWLLNPKDQTVAIYRPDQTVEVLQFPARLSGEEILVGFELDLKGIFN